MRANGFEEAVAKKNADDVSRETIFPNRSLNASDMNERPLTSQRQTDRYHHELDVGHDVDIVRLVELDAVHAVKFLGGAEGEIDKPVLLPFLGLLLCASSSHRVAVPWVDIVHSVDGDGFPPQGIRIEAGLHDAEGCLRKEGGVVGDRCGR